MWGMISYCLMSFLSATCRTKLFLPSANNKFKDENTFIFPNANENSFEFELENGSSGKFKCTKWEIKEVEIYIEMIDNFL